MAETGINTPQRDTKLREGRDVVCALKKNKTAQGGRMGMKSPGERLLGKGPEQKAGVPGTACIQRAVNKGVKPASQ